MKLRKFGKSLLLITAGIVCLLIICLILLVLILPSPFRIKESLKLKPQAEKFQAGINGGHDPKTGIYETSPEDSKNLKIDATPTSLASTDSRLAFEALIDPNQPLSETCRTLADIKNKQMGKMNSNEFGKRFQDSLLNKSSDPLMASLKPILKLTLTQTSMKTLISMVQESKPSERASLMHKLDFYRSAYDAYQEMAQNKHKMEHVLDQSYLTMMLGRAIEKRPDLARDDRVLGYCEEIEKVLNEGMTTDYSEEKSAFLNFLREAEIDPKVIGFDPNYQTHVQIVFNKNGLHFTGGWIDEVFAQLAATSTSRLDEKESIVERLKNVEN